MSAPPGYQPPSILFSAEEHAELAGELHARSLTHCLTVVVSSEAKHIAHKSLLVGRLAILLARKCQPRVLVVEADFDRPTVHETLRLEMPHGQGFSRQLKHRAIGRPKKPWTVRTTGPFLDLLGEGRVRCPGMLRSNELETALGELRTEYDVILLNAPSVEHSVEMRALSAVCDAALFAVPLGQPASTGAALIEYLFPQRFTQAVEVTGQNTRRA